MSSAGEQLLRSNKIQKFIPTIILSLNDPDLPLWRLGVASLPFYAQDCPTFILSDNLGSRAEINMAFAGGKAFRSMSLMIWDSVPLTQCVQLQGIPLLQRPRLTGTSIECVSMFAKDLPIFLIN